MGVIARVRALAVGIAKAWVDQQKSEPAPEKSDEPEPVSERRRSDRGRSCRRRLSKAAQDDKGLEMPDFLLEIGCEEIPARMIDAASQGHASVSARCSAGSASRAARLLISTRRGEWRYWLPEFPRRNLM